MDVNSILPLGSVVLLNGGRRKVMIIGLFQKSGDKVYDYCGLAHPFGYINAENIFVFNADKIKEVCFKGYADEDSYNYFDDLLWSRDRNKGGSNAS